MRDSRSAVITRVHGAIAALPELPLVAGMAILLAGCSGRGPDQEAERIIVSGASGQLGGLVVEELLVRGIAPENLILVSRTPEALAEYAAIGASTRFGDFNQPESLAAAYEGGNRMLLISINTMGQRPELHKNAIDAAVEAGVQHIAYTSFVDLENNPSPIATDHRLTEEHLRESGVAWTMLRNQLYMNGLVGQAAGLLATGEVVVDPDETRTAYVTREDCAAAAAAVLATPGHENMAYDITGPAAVSQSEIALTASEVTGLSIEVIDAVGSGAAESSAAAASGSGPVGGGAWTSVTSTAVADLTGRPPTSVREFLEAHRDAMLASVGEAAVRP